MRTSKGMVGIEFVIATAIFLAAFWFIFLQSALMLTPQLQRSDVREAGVEFYSSVLASEILAYESAGVPRANILDRNKLDAFDGEPCADVQSGVVAGMEFAFRVSSPVDSWECKTEIPMRGVVSRPVFVKKAGSYHAAVLEVWAS